MFSLFAPFLSFFIGVFLVPRALGNQIALVILALTSVLLIILGLVFGILALKATKRCGRKGIFGMALAGTCINGFLVSLMFITVPAQVMAGKRAKAAQQHQMEQRQQTDQNQR